MSTFARLIKSNKCGANALAVVKLIGNIISVCCAQMYFVVLVLTL